MYDFSQDGNKQNPAGDPQGTGLGRTFLFRVLHAKVANVIETLLVDRLKEFYGLLACHYSTVKLWEKAQEYYCG